MFCIYDLIPKCSLVNVFKIHNFLYWGSISAVLNFSLLFITHHGHVTQEQTGNNIKQF